MRYGRSDCETNARASGSASLAASGWRSRWLRKGRSDMRPGTANGRERGRGGAPGSLGAREDVQSHVVDLERVGEPLECRGHERLAQFVRQPGEERAEADRSQVGGRVARIDV